MRILIIRVGALGDVLHALPGVAALRKACPEATIDWVIDERWQPLLTGDGPGPIVDTVYSVSIKDWKRSPFSLKTLKSILEFRKLRGRYDVVIDMQGTLRSSLIGRLAGGKKLAGYADPREDFAKHLYSRKVVRKNIHVVDQGTALLSEACGLPLIPTPPQLPHAAWADQWAYDLAGHQATGFKAQRKLCILAPRAGWIAKQWPAEKFGLLAIELKRMGYTCMVNAPHKNDPLAAEVIAYSRGAAELAVCNVTGLIALVRQAALLISGDSGPLHLAAALGVPVVALFGPTNAARNGPWGPGPKTILRDPAAITSYKRRSTPDPGLARLEVKTVVAAVKAINCE